MPRRAPGATQDLLRLLIDSVTDYAIFVLDVDGTVRSWNPGAERLKGYRSDEIVGQHFSRFYTEPDLASELPWRALRIAESEGHFHAEGWRVRKDGSRFWADVTITPLREGDALVGFAKVTRDLTSRKLTEDALREAVDREREAVRQLRELDQMKDELVAVIAHELRGPIGVVRGFVDLLRDDWAAMTDEQKLEVLDRMATRAASLGRLVDDIFDVTRLEAGHLRVELAPMDLGALVTRLAAESAVAWPDRQFRLRVADDLPPVVADEQRAWQVIENLLSNAVKFSPSDAEVDLEVRAIGPEVAVFVHDRGPGIPVDDQDRVFDRFARLPRATDIPGSGMGLYIARRLAEAQGGELRATNRPGGGATFCFALRAARSAGEG